MKTNEQINNERKALKKYLGANGLTMTELANRLGITQSALSSQVSRGISSGMYARCALALGCKVEDLKPKAQQDAAATQQDNGVTPNRTQKAISLPFQCPDCGKVHNITITID